MQLLGAGAKTYVRRPTFHIGECRTSAPTLFTHLCKMPFRIIYILMFPFFLSYTSKALHACYL